MCEMKVQILGEAGEECRFDEVTSLEFAGDSVAVHTFFDEPKYIPHIAIERIDCLAHAIIFRQKPASPQPMGES